MEKLSEEELRCSVGGASGDASAALPADHGAIVEYKLGNCTDVGKWFYASFINSLGNLRWFKGKLECVSCQPVGSGLFYRFSNVTWDDGRTSSSVMYGDDCLTLYYVN